MKQRVVWIDYVKGLSMILVVLYHTQPYGWLLTLAQMPKLAAFFFLAGVFASGQWLKTVRLLIPYICFGVISYFFWLILRHFGADAQLSVKAWEPIWGLVVGTVSSLIQYPPLWFLTCLMTTELLFCCIRKIPLRSIQIIAVLLLAVIGGIMVKILPVLPWGLSSALVVLPLYWLGHQYKQSILTLQPKTWMLVIAFVLSCGLVIGMHLLNGYINVSQAKFGNIGYAYLAFGGTIILLFAIGLLLQRIPYTFKFLSFVGQNSLIYLVTHVTCFSLIKGIAVYIFRLPLTFFQTNFGCCILWICSLVIIMPIAWFIRKYIPFLIGSTYATKH